MQNGVRRLFFAGLMAAMLGVFMLGAGVVLLRNSPLSVMGAVVLIVAVGFLAAGFRVVTGVSAWPDIERAKRVISGRDDR